jgi:hypothetical protein
MGSLEKSLNKIAETILHLDEASLTSLWDTYKTKVDKFSNSIEWEKAVIIFSIITAVRIKNTIFNEKIIENSRAKSKTKEPKLSKEISYLKLVK